MDTVINCAVNYMLCSSVFQDMLMTYAAICCQVGFVANYSRGLPTILWADTTAMKDFAGPISRAAEALRLHNEQSELHQAKVKQLQDNYAKATQIANTTESSSSLSEHLRDALQPPKADRDEKLKEERTMRSRKSSTASRTTISRPSLQKRAVREGLELFSNDRLLEFRVAYYRNCCSSSSLREIT